MSKNIKLGETNVSTIGRFRLDVNRDSKKFTMTNINSFVPYGKQAQDRMKFMTTAGEVDSLIISKISTAFKPDENLVDNKNIEVLIQHPDVMITGVTADEYKELVRLNIKKANPKFTLTNMDRVETESFDTEAELVRARGILYSIDNPLTKQKLVWLSSNFGIPYRSNITDEKRYKISLTKGIDNFIQKKKKNRDLFVKCVTDIKTTEMKFYINELLNMGSITDIGGIYKVGDRPVGASHEHIINYFLENQDLYLQFQKQVQDSLLGTIVTK